MSRAQALALALSAGLLALLALWALAVGAADTSLGEAARALWSPGAGRTELVVRGVRLPRVIAALAVGGALGAAGGIMQAATGNPLAEPGLLGVNAGAAFAVVMALAFLGITATGTLVWAAFAGAAAAAGLVFALGSAGRSGPTPVKLTLAGVAVSTFLGALALSVLIFDARTLETVRLWTAGSLAGRRMEDVRPVLPWLLGALAAALVSARQFTTLSLGGETARALGQSPALWRGIAAALVVGLAGSAVALAGPIGFVGLVAPHALRPLVGHRPARLLPASALGGAALLLLADVAVRLIAPERDLKLGVMTALAGAPIFLRLVWRRRRDPA